MKLNAAILVLVFGSVALGDKLPVGSSYLSPNPAAPSGYGAPSAQPSYGAADDQLPSYSDDQATYGDEGGLSAEEQNLKMLMNSIPGTPGEDYPIYAEVPESEFSCEGKKIGGYYADPSAECQVFHVCATDSANAGPNSKWSFLCPNGTIFNQNYFICDWWFNFDCSEAEGLYGLNDQIGQTDADSQAQYGAADDQSQYGAEDDQNQYGAASSNQETYQNSPAPSAPANNGYGAPADSGYGAPADSGYGAPADSDYGAPVEGDYAAPAEADYGAPADSGYGAPADSGYGAPADSGYGAPAQPSYGAPADSGYGAPAQDAAASPGYGAPLAEYAPTPRTGRSKNQNRIGRRQNNGRRNGKRNARRSKFF